MRPPRMGPKLATAQLLLELTAARESVFVYPGKRINRLHWTIGQNHVKIAQVDPRHVFTILFEMIK